MYKFSVLMPVYAREQPQHLAAAVRSIWSSQTLRPNEITLVKDGPLTKALDKEIGKWKEAINREGGALVIVSLEKQSGLGATLNHGVKACTYGRIARMDADDIAHPERFQKQIDFMARHPEVDLVGSIITEFEDDPNAPTAVRNVPLHHEQIVRFAKTRNPFNHGSVLFKKEMVLRAGNYRPKKYVEDYDLWARMILNGAVTANIEQALVSMRAGDRMMKKRIGMGYMICEYKATRAFYEMGFLSFPELLRNLLIRIPTRILPVSILKWVYRLALRDALGSRRAEGS